MENKDKEMNYQKQIRMNIDGHEVTLSFSEEYNPNLSALVRNTLLDACIRKNGLCAEAQSA